MSDPQSLIMTPGVEFSASSYIYQPLPSDAIIDPHSAAWVGDLLQANAAVAPTVSIEQYTNPIFIVGANQPTVQISASYAPLSAQLSAVPLPGDFKPDSGSDHEAIIFQPSTGKYWEVWEAALTGATTTDSAGNVVPQWKASWGGYISNLATNSGSFSSFGTAASGLPLLAGLMTIAEQQAGVINHSIHISIPQALANVFVGAATRTDGGSTDPNAIPEGATFRLPADLDLDSIVMDPYTRMIAEAVQKYGMVVSDTNGSGVGFTAQNPDGLYATDPYYGPNGILHTASSDPNNPTNWGAASALLASFPWSDLEAVVTDSSGLAVPAAPTTTIESSGSTSLVAVGNNFYLNSSSYGFGPELKYGGAVFMAGQFGAWAPIGTEKTATGYEVALKVTGADQYTFWNTDSNGNYASNITGIVSGADPVVEFLESSFHQDLNGDGVIGVPGVSLPGATVIEAFGSTNLTEVNNNFYLYSNTTGSGPELKYGGAAVMAGQIGGAWAPIGAEKTATGYEVAWKVTGADQYTVWNTDSSGNYISNIGTVSGTSSALESLETSFHQDLNGDGVIGPPPLLTTVIESFGSISLVEVGYNFFLNSNGSGSGPELKYGGAAVVAGEFGAIAPIGAEQTATGYEVAWKVPGADQYTVWNTDSTGNYVSNIGTVSGTSPALESLETSFHQDLNGDGVIGVPVTSPASAVVVAGAASPAVQGGAAVTLMSGPPTITDSATTLSSATIKIANAGGSAVTGDELYVNGQQSGTLDGGLVTVNWNDSTKVLTLTGNASIAAYQTLLSEVAYQDAGTDSSTGSHPQRTVTWTANDGTANISTTSQIAIERAPVATVGNVVLNADFTTIAASSLVTASDPDGDTITEYGFMANGNGHFVLNGLAQGNNQEIDVTAAQISQLMYHSTVGTDSLQVRVNDGTLWSPWQSFTVAAPPATVIQTDGPTSLTEIGNQYLLDSGDGSGVALKYAGANVVAGQRGGWTPIGAEQTSTGYEVAWKLAGADQYTVWSTNSNGNYLSNLIPHVAGNSIALELLENTFHQDLNGDSTIGLVGKAIESYGSTTLLQVGNTYDLENISTGTGPELKCGGAAVTVGEYAGWKLIGAEQVAGGGYDVAREDASTDQFTVWSVNSHGNYLSNLIPRVAGNSAALETLETTFHQDLNGDGTIGLVGTAIESYGSTRLLQVGNTYDLENTVTGIGPELTRGGVAITAGEYAGSKPIGAEQVAGGGYDVAWENASTGQYSVWSTNSNGNYLSNLITRVAGNSIALESLETAFHQDLNGDGVIGIAVAANAILELNGARSDNVTFDSSTGTLKLDSPSNFAGQIIGFTGDGTLSGSDHVDLLNMRFSSSIQTGSSYDPSTGALTVSNGATVDVLHFVGSYSQDNFEFASDAHGGTIVYDPPTTSQLIPADASDDATLHITANSTINGAGPPEVRQVIVDSGATLTLDHVTAAGGTITNNGTVKVTDNSTVNIAAGAGHDNFVFAPNFGQATISHFTPGTDSLLIDHAIFSSVDALFAATHNSHGNAVITDAAHDTITIENVTTAQLLAHHSDFHLV